MKQTGFTLIELLITIAIAGILAASGTVGYQNYLNGVENFDAENGVRAIYLAQLDYRADSGGYWPTPGGVACGVDDCTSEINTNLFNGVDTLRSDSPFDFTVTSAPMGNGFPSSYTACAHNSVSGQVYLINQNNQLTEPAGCP
jgi:prepilin-type N-terminal cleavage/methylation domain-containing protein